MRKQSNTDTYRLGGGAFRRCRSVVGCYRGGTQRAA
jgi:hypothetical protein